MDYEKAFGLQLEATRSRFWITVKGKHLCRPQFTVLKLTQSGLIVKAQNKCQGWAPEVGTLGNHHQSNSSHNFTYSHSFFAKILDIFVNSNVKNQLSKAKNALKM